MSQQDKNNENVASIELPTKGGGRNIEKRT